MDFKINSNKAQITIFIIIAIIIVVAILLFFLLFNKVIPTPGSSVNKIPANLEPNSYIENCAKDSTKEAIDEILIHGGLIRPENSYIYESQELAYLCYNANFYNPCVMQYPKYIEHLETEIKKYTTDNINSCFNDLKRELQDKNFQVNIGNMNQEVELLPKKVRLKIQRNFKISKNGETKEFNDYQVQFTNPLYDLAIVAQEISSQEAKYCNFEYVGYMLFYPEFDIDKFVTWDDTKIYTVKHRDFNDQLRFAIRSCAMPPGL